MIRSSRVAATACAFALALAGGGALAKTPSAPSLITAQDAQITVVITAKTHVVNVHENDAVLFKVGTQQFAVKFDGDAVKYNLATLAPKGLITRKITVFVAPNPMLHQQGI
jgi:hypothetical protein